MQNGMTLLALAAIGFLAGCNQEEACTEASAQKKQEELMAKLMDVAVNEPEKMVEFAPKIEGIGKQVQEAGGDLQASCKAMDEMMAELSK